MQLAHMVRKFSKRQTGDTIVEVLIALTVLGFTLGISYTIVGKSNSGLQANKEQYQAQLLANQQVDYLRATGAGAFDGPNRNNFNGNFTCIKKNLDNKLEVVSDCKNIAMGGAGIYEVEISCVDAGTRLSGASCNTSKTITSSYSILITWDNVKGAKSRLELQYAM